MAGNQVTGDGFSANLAGMSKNQLYDIMSQMKTLIEQNQDQARQILIQNPLLTKALFQAQIMLGMVQPPQSIPNILPAGSQHTQQATPPIQPSKVQGTPLPSQSSLREQTSAPTAVRNQQQNQPTMPLPTPSLPPISPPLQPAQLTRAHINAQTAPVPLPQSSQVSNMAAPPLHYPTQTPSILQPTVSSATVPLQQPSQISSIPHLPLQPPLPSQPRPPSMQAFPHQSYSHMGPAAGYQHPGASQLHHSQPMFNSGSRPSASIGLPFSQGHPLHINQQLSQTLYQGRSPHAGMDFNPMGISPQAERGTPLPGPPPPFLPAQMSSASQPPRPASLTADMEKALLQQVMSLTPEQINLLPPEQRNQVLQLQQMLRQ